MDPNLLNIICCPVTREKLSIATSKQLEFINAEIANSTLKKLDGSIAEKPQSKALINATKTLLYPIEEDIPILLENEAIELKGTVI
tara:strand:- start:465 stop:722 length:258 start_codon:yes stop_codon:yes gene_type:complete